MLRTGAPSGVIELSHGLGLALETGLETGVGLNQFGREDLDRDLSIETGLHGFVDGPHSSLPEQSFHLVAGKEGVDGGQFGGLPLVGSESRLLGDIEIRRVLRSKLESLPHGVFGNRFLVAHLNRLLDKIGVFLTHKSTKNRLWFPAVSDCGLKLFLP